MSMRDIVVEEKRIDMAGQSAGALAQEPVKALPPLQSGDRLTRYEFERRYQAMPKLKKAELIEGVVYVPSPIRHKSHGRPHALIMGWLAVYHAATSGTDFSDNATVRLDVDNEVQPDALLRLESDLGGRSEISGDDYIEGPPELIVEIAASSAAYDLHDKLKVYRRAGVQEYIVWQIYDNELGWFYLDEKETYALLEPDEQGFLRSRVFPGLVLKVEALLQGNLAEVLTRLQESLGQDEHQGFVERLRAK